MQCFLQKSVLFSCSFSLCPPIFCLPKTIFSTLLLVFTYLFFFHAGFFLRVHSGGDITYKHIYHKNRLLPCFQYQGLSLSPACARHTVHHRAAAPVHPALWFKRIVLQTYSFAVIATIWFLNISVIPDLVFVSISLCCHN